MEFGNVLGFSREMKIGVSGEKLFRVRREPTTNSTHIRHRSGPESNPGHIGRRRAIPA